MQYDRTICIAVGGSRKSLTWQNSRLSVSELYKRFEHPVRSSETMQEYLHLKNCSRMSLRIVPVDLSAESCHHRDVRQAM